MKEQRLARARQLSLALDNPVLDGLDEESGMRDRTVSLLAQLLVEATSLIGVEDEEDDEHSR